MTSPIMEAARRYLLDNPDVDNAAIDQQLMAWKTGKKDSLSEIFHALLSQARNRNMMANVIGSIDSLEPALLGFDLRRVFETYQTPEAVIEAIKQSAVRPHADFSNKKGLWWTFARSVISAAKFLKVFNNAADFHHFIESFYTNEHSRVALPLLLAAEIEGYGFALACSFLKESGYEGFVKPDVHIKAICKAAGITESGQDYRVFKDVVRYCEDHGDIPYEFDKILWLVGSGMFTRSGFKVRTDREVFIRQYLSPVC